jgi:DNA invertase Pin-like site-specific DNA recombinase
LTEGLDITTAAGRLTLHIFAALAEFERALLIERTRAGLEAARARGRLGGRPRVMSSEKVAAARVLRDAGDLSMEEIASLLGVSRATLYRRLAARDPEEAVR